MRTVMQKMTEHFENVPDQLRKRRLLVWLFFIAMTVFCFMGMSKVKFDMTIEGWFAENDPTILGLDGFHAQFGSEDHLYIVYKPKDGDVFSQKSLEVVQGIREDLFARLLALEPGQESPLRHLVKVTTLDNAPVLIAEDDALLSKHLVGSEIPSTQQGLDEIRRIAESQKNFPLLYFSKDGRYGGIHIETNFGAIPVDAKPLAERHSAINAVRDDELSMEFEEQGVNEHVKFKSTDLAEYLAFMEAVKVTLNKPEFAEHMEYYPVGNPAATEYDVKVLEEMGSLYMGMFAIMIVILWLLFRSFSGVLWPLSIVVLSSIWTVGLTGWLGLTVTAFLILTVVMILAVSIADSIHLLSGYLFFRNKDHGHHTAMRMAFRESGNACVLTTVTTMVAMLALAFTPIMPIRIFGLMTAAGIGFAFLFSIYLLPLMVDLWSPVNKAHTPKDRIGSRFRRLIPDPSRLSQQLLNNIPPIVEKYKFSITFISFALFAICIYGSTKVIVDTNPIAQYPEDSQIRENFEIADQEMIGTQILEIYLDLDQEYAFQDPYVLERMDELQSLIEDKYSRHVVRTASLMDVVKKSYQSLNEDREDMYIIPTDKRVLSQTLFMFDNSNPVERRKMVSDDYSRSHITIYLRNGGSHEYTQIFEQLRSDIYEAVESIQQEYPNTTVSLTGMFALLMQGSDYLSWSSLTTFGMVIVIISIILLVVFGSFKAGLISLAPNLFPAILTFGLMGIFNIPLDFTSVLVAPIIVGIAVDDTIHFLTHYRNEMMVDGDIHRAIRSTFQQCGQAVIFTSLILGLGLSVLAFSSSVGNATVGIFGSLAIFVALVCDLFLLPAMILIFKPTFKEKIQDQDDLAAVNVIHQ